VSIIDIFQTHNNPNLVNVGYYTFI